VLRSLRRAARALCGLKIALCIPHEQYGQGNYRQFLTRTTNQPIRKTPKNKND